MVVFSLICLKYNVYRVPTYNTSLKIHGYCMTRTHTHTHTHTQTDSHVAPTVTPHVTLMGELPVVDAFQSHPFNGHLRREGHVRQGEGFRNKTHRLN